MLARLQKLLVFILIAASATWALLLARSGHPVWGGAIAALIVLGYAAFLALEFAALHSIPDQSPAPRARIGQLVAAWWGEVITAPRVFFWRQPFRSRVLADHVNENSAGRHGVVLVHGFVCNRGLWNPWMRKLRALDIPHIAVNLEPVFGSIDDYAQIIDAAVSRMQVATGQPVVLVGHSMGGLAIRSWLRRFDSDVRVRRVVTIGSPHHGTWLARFGHTQNGKQMRQRSAWLTQLAAEEPAARYERFTCFYGHCDNIVFPASTAMLPGAENLHVPVTAHVDMAFHPVVFNEALRWLSAAPVASVASTLTSADAR